MGNLRAKVEGSGSAEPNYSGTINDANSVGGQYFTPGWQNGAAWVPAIAVAGDTSGPNMESVRRGFPVWEDATNEFITQQGRFSFSDFCDLHNIGPEDRDYLSRKLKAAADAVRANPYLDNIFVNCCPQWNPLMVLCKSSNKRLLVRGGKLLLRVRHGFRPMNRQDEPRGLSVSATALPAAGQMRFSHELSLAFRRPNGTTQTGGENWKYYEYFKKANTSYSGRYFVTGEPVGDAGLETFCTVSQIMRQFSDYDSFDTSSGSAHDYNYNTAEGIEEWIGAHEPFSGNATLMALVKQMVDTAIATRTAAGCYYDQNENPIFVSRWHDISSSVLPADEHLTEWAATPYSVMTPPMDPDIDLADYPGTVATNRSVQVPFIFQYRGSTSTLTDMMRIVVDSGNTPHPASDDQFLYLVYFGFDMQWAEGNNYGLYPADGGPRIENYRRWQQESGHWVMRFKIPLSLFLEKTVIDGQERWSPNQHVVYNYYAGLSDGNQPFPLTQGSFYCGLEDGNITYPSEVPASHTWDIPAVSISDTSNS